MFQKRINKRNYFPNVLIKNNKNYRFSNRNLQKNENKEECLNITNCSKCVITKKKIEENKINGIYYERIYGGLDFQKKNNYENEKYKCKKNIHLGVQTPKELINLNNENSIRNINPYIEKNNKYKKFNTNSNCSNEIKNEYNAKYTNYSNYLKKKKNIKNKYCVC